MIGILGGIASGKSKAAALLAGPTGRVLAADALAHEILRSPAVAERVRARFGAEFLDARGEPDRTRLAERIFAGPDGARARAELEGWIHPAVRARIQDGLDEARDARVPCVVLDVPLLLENDAQHGFVGACHALVFVDADEAERDRRARETRGWRAGEVARREASQLPLAEKRARADFILTNNGSLDELERACATIRDALDARRA